MYFLCLIVNFFKKLLLLP